VDLSALGWPELTPVLLLVAGGTAFLVQKLKMIVRKDIKAKWTQKIPGWFWLLLSIALPIGLVALLNLDWVQAVAQAAAGPAASVDLEGQGVLSTGIATALGSQGAYWIAKKAGVTADYSSGGPNEATPMTDPMTDMTAPLSTETPSLPVSDTKDVPQDNPPVGELPMVKAVLLTEWQTVNPPTALMLTKDGVQQVFRLDWSD
jgi:hypothetical protein